ncbi:MAG: glycosyltransferase family 2 protein [Armatimonadota bacterium]|nr:glycosyltransferase family 2 protein [Armatimonadota bacterium]
MRPLLSVIIPAYNERATIEELVRRVCAERTDKEIIVVDDGSTDGTLDVLRRLNGDLGAQMRVLPQPANAGKGAALRRGFREARGEVVLVQDADLEYDPRDYPRLLAPLLRGEADVVYGSRVLGRNSRGTSGQRLGNWALTVWANAFTRLGLSDVCVCYKVFRRDVLERLDLREDRFGFDPEVTVKIARGGWRIREVPISYRPRTRAEGKKVRLKDALTSLWCVVRYSVRP